MRNKAPVIHVKPNLDRIMESIVYVIGESDRLGKFLTQYDLVKTIFLADRAHLNQFGRPITFDKYVAMEHGPVPSTVYDILKKHPDKEGLPWEKLQQSKTLFSFIKATRSYDNNILSESDTAELSNAFVIVKSLGFSQIRKLTHEDQAYIDAWEDDELKKAFDMSYMMLFDVPDFSKALDVALFSENI